MKKVFACLMMLLLSMSMFSCSANKYLERPENTNLEFWITQKVENEDFKNCTSIPGWFGASEYLDSRYSLSEKTIIPEKHVTYLVAGYPDCLDSSAITDIHITDPSIIVYGLTMESTSEEIKTTMSDLGFKNDKEQARTWKRNNCTFSFYETYIVISASQTNKSGIVY